jgi:WD40 repeat protein
MSHVETLAPGTELVGDFRIETVLDAGGFGITYVAREIALDRQVAIKEYFPIDFAARRDQGSAVPRSADCAPDYEWGLERFIDEAQTLARFDHPNIVRVFRYFRANNTAYIVMKYEEGRSFKRWLADLGRAPRQRELDQFVDPLLDALSVVHAADMLHRDIAPDNIIVRSDGSPVLIDFGAARSDLAQHSRTVSALVKPGYSPYEQYAEIGKQQGPWTDIYALAATLYHAITGKRPPDAPSRVVRDELVPAREAAISAYRARFLKAIDRGLLIDIKRRPQGIAEWRGDLLAPEEKGQRGWFGASFAGRQQAAITAGDVEHTAKTVVLGNGGEDGGDHADGAVPPPPDVPGHRGRIVDFLDGVRPSPRKTAMLDKADAVGLEATAERAGQGERAGRDETAGVATKPEKSQNPKRFGLFTRLAEVRREAPAGKEKPKKVIRVEAAKVAPAVAAARQPASPAGLRRTWRRPLLPPARRRGFGWLSIGAKLSVGVAVATMAVQLQATMPEWDPRHGGRLTAGGPPPLPQQMPIVTGSVDRRGIQAPERRFAGFAAASSGGAREVVPDGDGMVPANASAAAGASAGASAVFASASRPGPPTFLARTFEAHEGGVSHIAFARGGKLLVTAGGDGLLKIWDGATFEMKRSIELADGPAFSLAVLGEKAVIGHENGRIGLWHLDLGMRLKSFKRNDAPITALAFAGPNRFLAGASDWTVSLWDMAEPSVALHTFEGHERDVLAVAYQPKAGLIASASADRTALIWEAKTLSLVRRYRRQRAFITAIAFAPGEDAVLIGTLDGDISLYSTTSRRRVRRYRGHDERVSALTFLPGGETFVSASGDGTIRLWDVEQQRARQTFGAAGAGVRSVAVQTGNGVIASAKADGTVQIWTMDASK